MAGPKAIGGGPRAMLSNSTAHSATFQAPTDLAVTAKVWARAAASLGASLVIRVLSTSI